jgi:hypothetical protein
MKNYWKTSTLALAAAIVIGLGSNFLSGQGTTAVTPTGPGGPGARGPGRGEGRGGQPHMEMALVALTRAREQLDQAVHDKGGFRDKALGSIDRAIADVKDGIKYAKEHPEEFGRGGRGERGGPGGPGGGVTVAPTTPAT